MTRALIAAQSGFGKSWLTQQWSEENLDKFDIVAVADYKDEYRGLCAAGKAKWAAIGDREMALSVEGLKDLLRENERLVLARSVGLEEWREFVAKLSTAVQQMPEDALVVIDEAHFVAPQGSSYPEPIEELATTGRGQGVSSGWVTQRLQNLDETIISQADTRLIGGFNSERDLKKIRPNVPYDADVHNVNASTLSGWDRPVRRYFDGDDLVGSDWIYSTTDGDVHRIDTRELTMESTHYGGSDVALDPPGG